MGGGRVCRVCNACYGLSRWVCAGCSSVRPQTSSPPREEEDTIRPSPPLHEISRICARSHVPVRPRRRGASHGMGVWIETLTIPSLYQKTIYCCFTVVCGGAHIRSPLPPCPPRPGPAPPPHHRPQAPHEAPLGLLPPRPRAGGALAKPIVDGGLCGGALDLDSVGSAVVPQQHRRHEHCVDEEGTCPPPVEV